MSWILLTAARGNAASITLPRHCAETAFKPSRPPRAASAQNFHIMGLFAFFTHDGAEFDFLAFQQHAVAMAAYGAKVDKNVAAVGAADKTKSLVGVEPFDNAGFAIGGFDGTGSRSRRRCAPLGSGEKKNKQGSGNKRKIAQRELKTLHRKQQQWYSRQHCHGDSDRQGTIKHGILVICSDICKKYTSRRSLETLCVSGGGSMPGGTAAAPASGKASLEPAAVQPVQ